MKKGIVSLFTVLVVVFFCQAAVAEVSIFGLTTDRTDPINVGDTVTFSCHATDSDGQTVYYRFDIIPAYGTASYDPITGYSVMQDFSTDSTATYTFDTAGGYVVVAWASTFLGVPTGIPAMIGMAFNVSDGSTSPGQTEVDVTGTWYKFDFDGSTFSYGGSLTFSSDGTFSGSLSGTWDRVGNVITLVYTSGGTGIAVTQEIDGIKGMGSNGWVALQCDECSVSEIQALIALYDLAAFLQQ